MLKRGCILISLATSIVFMIINQLATNLRLDSSVEPAAWTSQLPAQILFVAKQDRLEDLEISLRKNVQRTLQLNIGMRLRWLGDAACEEFFEQSGDLELLRRFREETVGMYKGDLCRAAVLAKEGGFYVDLDVQLTKPFRELVTTETTFVSAFTVDRLGVLNAFMGARPGSPVLLAHLEAIRRVYQGTDASVPINQMGPKTLLSGLDAVMKEQCPEQSCDERAALPHQLEWHCGSEVFRLFVEDGLDCAKTIRKQREVNQYKPRPEPSKQCSEDRITTGYLFDGVLVGIFSPEFEHDFIGWSRFNSCQQPHCTDRTDLPWGPYQDSCEGCALWENRTILRCKRCSWKKEPDNSNLLSIDLRTCPWPGSVYFHDESHSLQCNTKLNALDIPPGPYQETCLGCELAYVADQMSLVCSHCFQTSRGKVTGQFFNGDATIALVACEKPGHITNAHGVLRCKDLPEADYKNIAQGSYLTSCVSCILRDVAKFSCFCPDGTDTGLLVWSTVDLSLCPQPGFLKRMRGGRVELDNDHGNMVC